MRPTMALLQAMHQSGCQSEKLRRDEGRRDAQCSQSLRVLVPASCTLEQGSEMFTDIALCRGAGLEGDVELDISSNEIQVTPGSIIIACSDAMTVQLTLQVGDEVACGDHIVHVTGTTERGEKVSTAFTVTVISRQH